MRKHWGWGATTEPAADDGAVAGRREHPVFGEPPEEPAPLGAISLPPPHPPRPQAPATDDVRARVTCAHGASYVDVVRAFRGEVGHAPDWVLQPTSEDEVAAALQWAADVDG